MAVPDNIVAVIRTYHERYRHPSLAPPQISGLYALFPNELCGVDPNLCWPNSWPQHEQPGVYFVFDKGKSVLYVGKAARLGQRISSYFRYTNDAARGCRIVHTGWSSRPMFVATVALTEVFEPPSMEEYLIGILNPPDNATWAVSGTGVI